MKTALLLSAVEVLTDEIALLGTEDWARLPDLKKRKVVVASRLRGLSGQAEATDGELFESLQTLLGEMEDKSRQHIRARLDRIGAQILALQELNQYWRECLNVSFRRAAQPPLGNDAPVV